MLLIYLIGYIIALSMVLFIHYTFDQMSICVVDILLALLLSLASWLSVFWCILELIDHLIKNHQFEWFPKETLFFW